MGYMIDGCAIEQIRAEALEEVKRRFVVWYGVLPVARTSDEAWEKLAEIAQERPYTRIGQYYWYSGTLEQSRFKAAYNEWCTSVNGF